MENIHMVRDLLGLDSITRDPALKMGVREQDALEDLFDLLRRSGEDGHIIVPTVNCLIKSGVGAKQPGIAYHLISPRNVSRVIKALAYAFPKCRNTIVQTVVLEMSTRRRYSSVHGNDLAILIGLFNVAGMTFDTDKATEQTDFDIAFLALLEDVVKERSFLGSPITQCLESSLSSSLAAYVKCAAENCREGIIYRWKGIQRILLAGTSLIMPDIQLQMDLSDEAEPVDNDLESELLEQFRFRCFTHLFPVQQTAAILGAGIPI